MSSLADQRFRSAVGMRLATFRQGLGLSRQTFSASIGIAPKTLEKYEQGAREISAYALAQAHRVHGLDLHWLLACDDDDLNARSLQSPRRSGVVSRPPE